MYFFSNIVVTAALVIFSSAADASAAAEIASSSSLRGGGNDGHRNLGYNSWSCTEKNENGEWKGVACASYMDWHDLKTCATSKSSAKYWAKAWCGSHFRIRGGGPWTCKAQYQCNDPDRRYLQEENSTYTDDDASIDVTTDGVFKTTSTTDDNNNDSDDDIGMMEQQEEEDETADQRRLGYNSWTCYEKDYSQSDEPWLKIDCSDHSNWMGLKTCAVSKSEAKRHGMYWCSSHVRVRGGGPWTCKAQYECQG